MSQEHRRRLDGWSHVPNSYVNDDGEPNLENSNVDNENNARVAVGWKGKLK